MMNIFSKWFWLVLVGIGVVAWNAFNHFSAKWRLKPAEELKAVAAGPGSISSSGPERSQIIYSVKGDLSERIVRALYPDLVMDGGTVAGYCPAGQEARILRSLAALDMKADAAASSPSYFPLRGIGAVSDPDGEETYNGENLTYPNIQDGATKAALSYRFGKRQVDQALVDLVKASAAGLTVDLSTGEVFGEVDIEAKQPVLDYLAKLDQQPETVRLEAMFIQVSVSGSEDSGLSWFVDVGSQLGFRHTDFRLRSETGAFTVAAGTFGATIEAALSSGKANVISRPALGLALGSEGLLRSGREVAVPQSTVSQGVIQQQVEFRPIEFVVKVVVRRVGEVYRVTLEQQSNEIIGYSEIAGNLVPEIASQGLTSAIDSRANEWVLLGGIAKDTDSAASSRSRWFLSGNRSKRSEKTELVLAFRIVDKLDQPSAWARKL